ncbi:MAG: hypothetical protein IJ533_10545 [Prevotella sp.]|nr:hypothetical protein [Prevotella sp.]MBQ8488071.1 hypothetical protein [Prevotella sp.]
MQQVHTAAVLFALHCLLFVSTAEAQTLSGSIQSDILFPQEDSDIGATKDGDWAKTNTFAELHLQSQYVDAGARVEYLDHPLPGFEPDYAGWGVPHFYVKGRYRRAELTLGDFYEQFGSGFILRTYEERSLGIDGALRGGRLQWQPLDGLTLKLLSGCQRRYWEHNDALVSGADVQYDVTLSPQSPQPVYLTLGASWVNKHEADEDLFVDATHRRRLPVYVNAYDVRARLQTGPLSLLAEYAGKTQDPTFDNGYTYDRGHVAMLSATWSRRGMSLLLQGKRSENMSFRSRRTMDGTSSMLNHLPAFTLDHTYALAALYPYATQPDGEWAWQVEGSYTFPRRTTLGGRYGTTLKLNFSHVRNDGETYYQDLNLQMDKKVSADLKLNLMYMNQRYNKTVVEGEGGMVNSHILVGEAKYRFTPKLTLRGEAQYLFTSDDEGDWAFGLLELSVVPHWMLTLSDMYNAGDTHNHYYQGAVTYNTGAHRLQLGYGRTRAGFNCSGGVCRYVPATRGVTLSYNYNF